MKIENDFSKLEFFEMSDFFHRLFTIKRWKKCNQIAGFCFSAKILQKFSV